MDLEKIFANRVSDEGLVSRFYINNSYNSKGGQTIHLKMGKYSNRQFHQGNYMNG